MDKQAKKDFLSEYQWITARIDVIDSELKKEIAVDDVQFKGEKAEKDAVKHVSKGERLLAERQELAEKKETIEKAIDTVSDSKEKMVLNSVYISGRSVERVARDMHVSQSTAYRIFDRAIENVRCAKC